MPPTFIHAITEVAQRTPTKLAAAHREQEISYGELLSDAARLAAWLTDHGAFAQRVLVCLPNSLAALKSLLACFIAGAVYVPVHPKQTLEESFTRILAQISPVVVITTEAICQQIGAELLLANTVHLCLVDSTRISSSIIRFESLLNKLPATHVAAQEELAAVIAYTSGSTGNPKGPVHTYGKVTRQVAEHARLLAYTPDDRSLVCLAMDRAFCLTSQILPALYAGASLIIQDDFDAVQVCHAVADKGITRLYLYPHMCHQVARAADIQLPHALRTCVVGADYCSPATHIAFRKAFGAPVLQSMGMVETLAHSLNRSSDPQKFGSAGTPINGAKIRIVDSNGNALPAGEAGQIVIESPLLMTGYFGQLPLANPLFSTGDIGMVDTDGFLWFLGRQSSDDGDLSLLERIQQIKGIIYSEPSVVETAVVSALPNSELTAFVAIDNQSKWSQVENSLTERCQPYTLRFVNLPSLPKLPSGKIDSTLLLRLASE
jgi:long-chain acyl-CoA synthetase